MNKDNKKIMKCIRSGFLLKRFQRMRGRGWCRCLCEIVRRERKREGEGGRGVR